MSSLAEPRRPDRIELGLLGEAAAADVLQRAGLRILERRFRRRIGEVDLVAEQSELLVFVEVKTRRGVGFGSPAESVTPGKQRRMARIAQAYLTRHGQQDRPCRFDVVEVFASGSRIRRVRHIVDAFRLWPGG